MYPEDKKRLEREADIARAVRSPDYSRLNASIARNTAAASDAKKVQAKANREFDMHAARAKAMRDSVFIPPVRIPIRLSRLR